MSENVKYLDKAITSWKCGCRPESMQVGLAHKTCPYCRKTIPRDVCTQVYLQVLRELKAETLQIESDRWNRTSRITSKCKPYFIVLGCLAITGWIVLLFVLGIRNTPGVSEKLPDLLQVFPMLWQKLLMAGKSLLGNFYEFLQSVRWRTLLEKLQELHLEVLFDRLKLLAGTAVKLIGLTLERIVDLFRLIGSFISSLLS